MAERTTRLSLLAPLAIGLAAVAGLGPLLWLAVQQGRGFGADPYVWAVLGFTLWQAALSTVLSLVLGLAGARLLARRQFAGKSLLMALLAVPQALPSIVVVLALVTVYGQAGLLPGLLPLYGLGGILLAQVFFNAPLALRMALQSLEDIPPESLRLADSLGFDGWSRWRIVEWPALRPIVPRVAALIFLLCAASFVIVLSFGGPSATTLEVAIYQSLRMDFDPSRTLTLVALQVALCLVLTLAAGRAALLPAVLPRVRRVPVSPARMDGVGMAGLALTLLLVVPPLAMLCLSGVLHLVLSAQLLRASVTSLMIALPSAALAVLLAGGLARISLVHGSGNALAGIMALMAYIVPPAVLATGWFLLMQRFDPGSVGILCVIMVLNALMALPFAAALLFPALARVEAETGRLASQLGLAGWTRFQVIELPLLRPVLAQAFVLAFVMSFGDLTAVTLLGNGDIITLPSLIAQEMGHYRGAAAEGTALVLAMLCLCGSLLAQWLGQDKMVGAAG